jgi:hypothetical protein
LENRKAERAEGKNIRKYFKTPKQMKGIVDFLV